MAAAEPKSTTSRWSTEEGSTELKHELGEEVILATELTSAPLGVGLPLDSSSSDNPYYDPNLEYTQEEERRVVRILDMHLFTWVLLTTFVLNMDRTNIANAISDNLPGDLGFDINVVNTSTAVYSVLFSVMCLSGAVVAKLAGPAQCEWCSLKCSGLSSSPSPEYKC